jgi:hypothetical protein
MIEIAMATPTQMPAAGRAVQSGADTKKASQAKASVETEIDSVPEDSTVSGPSPDEIAQLAYSYWLDRDGNGVGSAEEDWLRAENELRGTRI